MWEKKHSVHNSWYIIIIITLHSKICRIFKILKCFSLKWLGEIWMFGASETTGTVASLPISHLRLYLVAVVTCMCQQKDMWVYECVCGAVCVERTLGSRIKFLWPEMPATYICWRSDTEKVGMQVLPSTREELSGMPVHACTRTPTWNMQTAWTHM